MSRRTEAPLIVDYPRLRADYDHDDRRKLLCLVRRMQHLQERLMDPGDDPDTIRTNHYAQEYEALHFVLEKLGVVRFEATVTS